MKRFADLTTALDETTRTDAKIEALVGYWRTAPAEDAAWTVNFLTGRTPRQAVPAARLRRWAAQAAGIPDWLFEASYQAVGDLAETISLVLPPASGLSRFPLHRWVTERLLPLRGLAEPEQRDAVVAAWREMDHGQRFVWNKLVTGGFRAGVSQNLVTRSLAQAGGVAEAVIAHRLMGDWDPDPGFLRRLFSPETKDADVSRPYPFCLATPLDGDAAGLGDIALWQAEWKWDGLRAQVIRRGGQVFIWSHDEGLVTEKFPEIRAAADKLPDGTVIDGEILAWREDRPLGFSHLQRRIGRKNLEARLLADVPVVLMACDLLESGGADLRENALTARAAALERLVSLAADPRLRRSPPVAAGSWQDLGAFRHGGPPPRRRGADAQTTCLILPCGAVPGRLVEVEGRPAQRRCGAGLRPGRAGPALRAVHRLHLRRPGRGGAGALRQGRFRSDRRRNPCGRPFHPREHRRAFRAGALRPARACLRDRLRGHPPIRPAPLGRGRAPPRIARGRPDKKVRDADTLDTVKALLRKH